mmetsp:Transcript_26149/g.31818  ORF Transcript_26149/g.31818 Transcript_26149/m.31818 type:complete len:187 (+) Transcript_26149:31-591(+)
MGCLSSKQERNRVLMLGLDAAGKTTILHRIMGNNNDNKSTVPTIGFNVENFDYNDLKFTIWDLGGQDTTRNLWEHYFDKTQVIIYVIDSWDKERFQENKIELKKILNNNILNSQNTIYLIYLNKQDLNNTINKKEFIILFDIKSNDKYKNDLIYVQETSAINNKGINDGLDWISNTLKKLNELNKK